MIIGEARAAFKRMLEGQGIPRELGMHIVKASLSKECVPAHFSLPYQVYRSLDDLNLENGKESFKSLCLSSVEHDLQTINSGRSKGCLFDLDFFCFVALSREFGGQASTNLERLITGRLNKALKGELMGHAADFLGLMGLFVLREDNEGLSQLSNKINNIIKDVFETMKRGRSSGPIFPEDRLALTKLAAFFKCEQELPYFRGQFSLSAEDIESPIYYKNLFAPTAWLLNKTGYGSVLQGFDPADYMTAILWP